jgi:carbamate kinase
MKRVVVALGGNALIRRGEALTMAIQERNVGVAAEVLARVAREHELVITHGNGPQVGLLALQSATGNADQTFPLDVLGAETEGMIGYMIERELANRLPKDTAIATLLTMVEVEAQDPAFTAPTKFVGPLYAKPEADRVAKEQGWVFRQDGTAWRRVVPSPAPKRIVEIASIRRLLECGTIVICAGGGGIPTTVDPDAGGKLVGVEAVIDKDLCSALLAIQLEADALVLATDVDAVYLDWGGKRPRKICRAPPPAIGSHDFPAGSMGPKVDAACRFASATGRTAIIGSLDDIDAMLRGDAGTHVGAAYSDLVEAQA